MDSAPLNAVIRFEPDGYDLDRPWLLGRQVAGNGFLRAAVEGRGEGALWAYTASQESAQRFTQMVREWAAEAETHWIFAGQPRKISGAGGMLYLGDPLLTPAARLRLRVGPASYSLCGVTHTISSGVMQNIAEMLSEPVMPWDALVCTSRAALQTAKVVLEAQADFLRWRFGEGISLPTPELPIIPLGVHCADFDFDESDRQRGRQELGIADDEFAALYVGRINFTGKAHPFPLFDGLQRAAARTGKRLVLVQCGRAFNQAIAEAYASGAAAFAPDVRFIEVDSRPDANRRNAWAAGDVFISLSDGIQETFGLTPIEAMAAGLPAIVSDWNGYRETVRDGLDGFTIPTWAPDPGEPGELFAAREEVGTYTQDRYCWAAAATTSMEIDVLVDRLAELIARPELRRSMGESGHRRAREVYDWPKVFRQYQALWAEMTARRLASAANPEEVAKLQAAPRAASFRLDPFKSFAHYATHRVSPTTPVSLAPGANLELYRRRSGHVLFSDTIAPERFVVLMWPGLERGGATVMTLGAAAGLSPDWAVIVVATLAKMGLVILGAGS